MTGTRKRRRTTGGKRQVPASATVVPETSPAPAASIVSAAPAATAAPTPSTPATPAPAPTAGGATSTRKNVKVVLAPPSKKKPAKVILTPAKAKAPTAASAATGAIKKLPDKTRKVSKKIRMSLGGLSKRMTRAHSIRQEAKAVSLTDVKATLQKAGLIKQDSKAPEQVLRQMYADFQMLKNRAL